MRLLLILRASHFECRDDSPLATSRNYSPSSSVIPSIHFVASSHCTAVSQSLVLTEINLEENLKDIETSAFIHFASEPGDKGIIFWQVHFKFTAQLFTCSIERRDL